MAPLHDELDPVGVHLQEQIAQLKLPDLLAQLLHHLSLAPRLQGIGDIDDHVQIAHVHRAQGVALDGGEYLRRQLREGAAQGHGGREAVQDSGHGGKLGVQFHPQLVGPCEDAGVIVALVPVVQKAGHPGRGLIGPVDASQRLGRLRHAEAVLETTRAHPLLQLVSALLVEFLATPIGHGRLPFGTAALPR